MRQQESFGAVAGIVIAVVATCAPAADPVAPERLPRDELLVYRDAAGRLARAATVSDWERRRAEILQGAQMIMGSLPDDSRRVPLDVVIDEEVDCGSYVRRLISYASEPGCRVPAYLCVPKKLLEADGGKAAAVLCLHGTNDVIGHGTVVGLGVKPNRQYAAELAERGFVTIAPSYPLLARYRPDLDGLGWESGTLKAVWDNRRALDLLDALPFVAAGRYGAIGHSLGGHNAVFTALFDPRVVAVVSSCGLDSFLDYYGGKEDNWLPEKGWTQTRYMPKLRHYRGRLAAIPFDFHELVAALAPRRVLIIAPLHDGNFRAESVDRIVAAARPVYALYGEPDRLTVRHPDCGHDFPPAEREAAYEALRDAITAAAGAPPALGGEPVNPVEFRQVGIMAVWDKYADRLTFGRGQTLALVDDGCDLKKPEWTASVGGLPKVRVTHDSVDGDDDPRHEGRGYHGTTIGIPSSLNYDGRRGVAYGNQVAVIRALECCHCNVRDSGSVAAGLQWIVENAAGHGITTVNLAPVDDLEHGEPYPSGIDAPLRKLREMGIWVSAPTGNHDFKKGISWPACQPDCFAIGAVRPGADEVYLDRHSKVDLVAPGKATSTSNAIVRGAAMILREAIGSAAYDWKTDGPTLPEAMMAIFQRTGTEVDDPGTGRRFRRLDLLAAVEHVLGAGDSRGRE